MTMEVRVSHPSILLQSVSYLASVRLHILASLAAHELPSEPFARSIFLCWGWPLCRCSRMVCPARILRSSAPARYFCWWVLASEEPTWCTWCAAPARFQGVGIGSGGWFTQHDQQHARGLARVDAMRDAGGQSHDGTGPGRHRFSADRKRDRSIDHKRQRVVGRGVFSEALTGIEREERHVAAAGLREHAAGDAALGWRNQIDKT